MDLEYPQVGITVFRKTTNETAICSICKQPCKPPVEVEGCHNLSAAMAQRTTKWWDSTCRFLEHPQHKDALILWKRIKSADKYTTAEKQDFQAKLTHHRLQIATTQMSDFIFSLNKANGD